MSLLENIQFVLNVPPNGIGCSIGNLLLHPHDQPLSSKELNDVAYRNNTITLKQTDNITTITKIYRTEQSFTLQQIIDVIIDFQNITRPVFRWFGNIDTHHIFFEELSQVENGVFEIYWGS